MSSLPLYCGVLYCLLFYTDWWGEQSSGIVRWTVLKTVLNRLVRGSSLQVYCGGVYCKLFYAGVLGGSFFRYTAVGRTEGCFILVVAVEVLFVLPWTVLKTFITCWWVEQSSGILR